MSFIPTPLSEVYNEDCMLGMARYPDKYFDLAIVDPPYGIDITGIWGSEKHGYKQYSDKGWDKSAPSAEYFNQLLRVSKNQIIWGANHFIALIPINSSCWVIWDKGQRDFTLADAELAWTSFENSVRVFDYSRAKSNREERIHPTQKPTALYNWLLQNYAKPNDKILDTHLGSGSSRIAAYKMGFDFTGFEIDPDYFSEQEKRFKQAIAQPLFDPPKPQQGNVFNGIDMPFPETENNQLI